MRWGRQRKNLYCEEENAPLELVLFLTRVLQFPNARWTIYKNDILSIVDPARQFLNSIWPDDTDTHRCVDISISVVFPLWPFLGASSSAWSLRNYLWDAWVHPCNYILSDIRSNCETAMNELGSYIDLLWSCFSLALCKHLCWFVWPLCSADFTGWSWPCFWQSESQPHSSRWSQVIILLLLSPQITETDQTHKICKSRCCCCLSTATKTCKQTSWLLSWGSLVEPTKTCVCKVLLISRY